MPKATEVDSDVMRAALGVKALREAHDLTQRQCAEAHVPEMSYQYWGMNETGRVPGIVKPDTQRKLLDAISRAAELKTPLGLDDLARAMGSPVTEIGDSRIIRMAQTLRGAAGERQAVFPTSDGDVIFSYPADMGPDGFRELEAYFQVFVKVNAPKT